MGQRGIGSGHRPECVGHGLLYAVILLVQQNVALAFPAPATWSEDAFRTPISQPWPGPCLSRHHSKEAANVQELGRCRKLPLGHDGNYVEETALQARLLGVKLASVETQTNPD